MKTAFPEINEIIDNLSLTFHLGNSSIGIILWNKENEMIYCSPKAKEIFEWEDDESLYKPFSMENIVHPDDLDVVLKLVAELHSGNVSHTQGVNRNITETGRVIYCQWYNSILMDTPGSPVHSVSLVQDITEQMQTSISLQASEHELSLVFDGAIDPMWVIAVEDKAVFKFENINTAFTKVTGWKKEQVIGNTFESVMPASSHELVREKYNEAVRSGKIIDYVEEAVHPAGIKYGEIRVIPIRDKSGAVTRLLGFANDITDKVQLQKKLDTERNNLNRQITAAAIKGQELERAKVSRELHDNVNQVLTTVKLYLELCAERKVDVGDVLYKSARLLNGTINDIRLLSKQLSAPSLADMNFRETLRELAASIGSASQLKINVAIGLKDPIEMEADLHLTIYRIVQEQLTNIIKYARADLVQIQLSEKNGKLDLTIADNGIGFDTSVKTTGLGLTNMRSRAEILGGNFLIESDFKKGTTVTVSIPVIITGDKCLPAELPRNIFPGI